MKISVVVPVYFGEMFLVELHERIRLTVTALSEDWELILVNDASPDNSWAKITELCQHDPHVKGINLSRNFGQHYAITAGLSRSSGDWIVVMDCDLQDVPEEIKVLFAKAQEGYDIVLAQRISRQDGFWKRMSSKLFYKFFYYVSDIRMDASVANFGIYRKKVIDAALLMGDCIRYFPAMIHWVGFRQCAVPVKHAERKIGKSSYSFWKLCALGLNSIMSYSDKPLRLITYSGVVMSLLSMGMAVFYFCLGWLGYIVVHGYASIIFSIWFIGSIQLMTIGIVGLYVGKIFSQVKNRPVFIISEEIQIKENRNA